MDKNAHVHLYIVCLYIALLHPLLIYFLDVSFPSSYVASFFFFFGLFVTFLVLTGYHF